eukprot:CAMPEP_0169266788 /NCGR_PEP_ID=MMETSP1016-20121227/46668_1 /TAXON_ID=342587 /ORGANISM="Karlodinium micrum, Strain CCMP2283" /LENGTH=49 /DNA_ID= /DNA_START= /DNA_END= /DNA_ORIENTATION=
MEALFAHQVQELPSKAKEGNFLEDDSESKYKIGNSKKGAKECSKKNGLC